MNKWTFFILHHHISITAIRQHATLNYPSLRCDTPFSCDKQRSRLHSFNFCANRMAFLNVLSPSLPPSSLPFLWRAFVFFVCRSLLQIGEVGEVVLLGETDGQRQNDHFPFPGYTENPDVTNRTAHSHIYAHAHTHTRIPHSFWSEEKKVVVRQKRAKWIH